jgi:glycerophosphoryl diester phosphodiesterase
MRRILGIVVGAAMVAAGLAGADVAAANPEASPWSQRRVLNVAHAGGDLEAPHSTLFAMKTGVDAGVDVLEMDLRLSADGVLMVQHDSTVNRTTGASGVVNSFTADELQAMDNAYWFTPNCWSCHGLPDDEYGYRGIRTGDRPPPAGFAPTDFSIPMLSDVASAFPHRLLDVEIKDGPDGFAAAEALAEFIASDPRSDRYLVASFDDEIMAHFKSLAPGVATSPGLGETTEWFATRGPLPDHQVLQVPPSFSGIEVVTQEFVDDAHDAELAVWVWFNGNDDDSPGVWQHLIDIGVDALLTGKPAAAQTVIDANDAGFSVAPLVDVAVPVRGTRATIDVGCPALHVGVCSSRVVIVARDRHDQWVVVGQTDVTAPRGTEQSSELRLSVDGRRLLGAAPLRAYGVLFPLDGDTGLALVPMTLSRD